MSSARAATGPHVLRQINIDSVLSTLRTTDAAVRVSELVTATGLSRPAVSRALGDLLDAGLAEAVDDPGDDAEPRVGRPAQRIRFRAGAGHVAGVDVGPHKVLAKVGDLAGRILGAHRIAVTGRATGPRLLAAAADAVTAACGAAGVAPTALWAVTVASVGLVAPPDGGVRITPSIPGWAGLPVVPELRARFGCPVAIDNDVSLALLAERWRGVAHRAENAVFVQWGERVGTSILIGGAPYRGTHTAAGELGFLDVLAGGSDDPASTLTGDGMGPFERQVGAGAMVALARAASDRAGDRELHDALIGAGTDRGLPALFAFAAAANPTAVAVVDEIAARFARGLAALVLLLDPEVVIIGGGVSRAGEQLLDRLRAELERRVLVAPRLVLSALGEEAVALGALRHALDTVEERLQAVLRQPS